AAPARACRGGFRPRGRPAVRPPGRATLGATRGARPCRAPHVAVEAGDDGLRGPEGAADGRGGAVHVRAPAGVRGARRELATASSRRDVGREPGTPSPSSNRSRSRSANARAPASIWAHRSRPARVPTTYPSPKNTARPSVLLPSIVASLLPGADGGDRRAGRG